MNRILFAALLGLAATACYAHCPGRYFPDTGICQIQGNNGELIHYNIGLPNRSSQPEPQKVIINHIRLPDKWGAISFRKDQPYLDSSDNLDSEAEARKVAIERCEKAMGSPCLILMTYKNGCATVADGTSKKNTHNAFAGGGATVRAAEQEALSRCRKYGYTNCRIVMNPECSLPKIP